MNSKKLKIAMQMLTTISLVENFRSVIVPRINNGTALFLLLLACLGVWCVTGMVINTYVNTLLAERKHRKRGKVNFIDFTKRKDDAVNE